MEIGMYDVLRLKDGREVTVLEVDLSSNELIVTDQEDVFPIYRVDVQTLIWVNAKHQSS